MDLGTGALYPPKLDPDQNCLQIVDHHVIVEPQINPKEKRRRRQRLRYKSKTFTNYSQTLDNKDYALGSLLSAFGDIIPKCSRNLKQQECPRCNINTDRIEISQVSFYNLRKFISIKIEWVDCVSQHLEFDDRTKTLKLFRFPSLCFIMCRNQQGSSSIMNRQVSLILNRIIDFLTLSPGYFKILLSLLSQRVMKLQNTLKKF